MLLSLYACIIGFCLDLFFGDPHWMWFHPIRLIGTLIAKGEKFLRKVCEDKPKRLMAAGAVLFLFVSGCSFFIPYGILRVCREIHPLLMLAIESVFCYFLYAAKSLKVESMSVYKALCSKDLEAARKAVSMIVGRDVNSLDEEGVAKAAVETVAENTSDGVIAPMLFMVLGGAPLGFFYKAINTMDSMIAYKNERYIFFGRFAARADDLANYIPARLSAFFMLAASYLMPKFHGKNALKIYLRDRKKSESPNSAQTEAVCAGALQVCLLGDAYYFGELHKKECIGDPIEPVTPEKILQANQLMYAATVIGLFVMVLLKFVSVGD